MLIRPYQESDCREIADLFHGSVHAIDHSIYSKEQLEAWAPTPSDYGVWRNRLEIRQPFIAVDKAAIIGFVELERDGHIDCFYVHKEHQGKGVARSLLSHLQKVAVERNIVKLYVEASKVAMPFFKKYGFKLQSVNQVSIRGQVLTNYCMSLAMNS